LRFSTRHKAIVTSIVATRTIIISGENTRRITPYLQLIGGASLVKKGHQGM
jgi:hypothetical protein